MTQNQTILNHLKKHGYIDPITALKRYGIFRLASRVHSLREQHNIKTVRTTHKGKTFAVYTLNNEKPNT